MKTIFNFFVSFEKLMKEKLVKAFYWLALIAIALKFGETLFEAIWLGPLAGVLRFFGFFVGIVFAIVALRLLCETLIALFRINDNLAPDGGKSETADVDLLGEARKAAENAASKARDAAKTASDKTRSAIDKTKDAASDLGDKVDTATSKTSDTIKSTARKTKAKAQKTVDGKDITIEPPQKTPTKKTPTKKPAAKKTASKKTAFKKTASKKVNQAKSAVRLKKDGTAAKKPGPKTKS